MNNNRNNRRRGRGNNRNQGGGNQANRIDSRARGNAPQLLDKFKKLAQDAQHNGDRVQAEYYLQFADHYFRVIADNKARQDEVKGKRSDDRDASSGEDEDEDGDDRRRTGSRAPRGRRDDRDHDDNRRSRSREDDGDGEGAGFDNSDNPFTRRDEEGEPKKRRAPRKPKKALEGTPGTEGEIDAAVLPPSIGAGDSADDARSQAKPAPRRRRRKQDDDSEMSAVG